MDSRVNQNVGRSLWGLVKGGVGGWSLRLRTWGRGRGEGYRLAWRVYLAIQSACWHTSSHFCLLLHPMAKVSLSTAAPSDMIQWQCPSPVALGALPTGFHRPSHPLAPGSSHIPCQAVGVELTLGFGRLIRPWRAPCGKRLGLVAIIVVGMISLG